MRTLPVDRNNACCSSASNNQNHNSDATVSEHFYQEKLRQLKNELEELKQLRHPVYVEKVAELDRQLDERLECQELIKQLESERIEREYESEQRDADRELDERKNELMESLYSELEEKRKQVEHEYQTMDLTAAAHSFYPANKKSLRRRPNEPTPLSEKRQRKRSPPQISYNLCETQLNQDLLLLLSQPSQSSPVTNRPSSTTSPVVYTRQQLFVGDPTATIEGSKLNFDGKCFLRGQTVLVEMAETSGAGKYVAVIQSIGNKEIALKAVGESRRLLVTLSDLHTGRVVFSKRNTNIA